MLDLLWEHWDILLSVLVVLSLALFFGWRQALVALVALSSMLSYSRGRKDEREVNSYIRKEQQDEYKRIDGDKRTGSDAAERLRDGKF